MGILDDLKHKAEELADKAREGFDAAKDKAGDLVDDAKERFGDDDGAPLAESSDVGPDSASTDAEQPGYVTGEDDVDIEDDIEDDDADDDADDADETVAAEDGFVSEPVVATDIDPYDAPLTQTIGDEIASATVDQAAVAEAVGTTATEQDSPS